MARISVTSTSLPSVLRAINALPATLDNEIGTALRAGMTGAKTTAIRLATPDNKLSRTIYVRTAKGKKGWSSTLGANAPQARIREYGGTIRALNKPYLVFMGRDGHLVQVKEVTQKARPYLAPARLQARDDLVQGLRGAMVKSVRTIG